MPNIVYLSLGSNLGDKRGNLSKAVKLIDALPCTGVEAVSEFFESAPQGLWSSDKTADFVNICVRIHTVVAPLRLLDLLKEIERQMGREESVRYTENSSGVRQRIYSDRVIDIDILMYGSKFINTPRLMIPHPKMLERDFVMIPLMEVLRHTEKSLKAAKY